MMLDIYLVQNQFICRTQTGMTKLEQELYMTQATANKTGDCLRCMILFAKLKH